MADDEEAAAAGRFAADASAIDAPDTSKIGTSAEASIIAAESACCAFCREQESSLRHAKRVGIVCASGAEVAGSGCATCQRCFSVQSVCATPMSKTSEMFRCNNESDWRLRIGKANFFLPLMPPPENTNVLVHA